MLLKRFQDDMARLHSPAGRARLNHLLGFLARLPRNTIYVLLPGWLRAVVFREAAAPSEKPRIHATSHLDGLRGIAAVIVVNFHYLFAYRQELRYHWDTPARKWDNPVTELFVAGVPMVAIFFAVSGYVISLKPLQLMHAMSKDSSTPVTHKKLLYTLCSSIFRRAFRIYLPPMIWTLLVAISVYYGWWEPSRRLLNRNEMLSAGYNHDMIDRKKHLGDEVHIWWGEWQPLLNFFSWNDYYPHIGFQLWTIPKEYGSSLVLYALLLALSFARPIFRLLMLCTATYYVDRYGRWEVMLFIAGAALAEYRLVVTNWRLNVKKHKNDQAHLPLIKINGESSEYNEKLSLDQSSRASSDAQDEESGALEDPLTFEIDHPSPRTFVTFSKTKPLRRVLSTTMAKALLYALFLFTLYILSTPQNGIPDAPGYALIVYIFAPLGYGSNDGRWIQSWGAVLILFCLLHMRPKRRISDNEAPEDRAATVSSRIVHVLNCRFAQFLGRISFAIYICHMAVLQCVGTWVVINTWDLLRKSKPANAGIVMGDVAENVQRRDNGVDMVALQDAVNNPENLAAWVCSLWVGWGVCILLTVCIADVFQREVDGRCVRFARFVERVAFVKTG